MSFNSLTYTNFVSTSGATQERLFPQYSGDRSDFDIIVIGSGIGGGVLADDLADRLGGNKRILVLEAGSFIYPTHVYNICRFPNSQLAKHFGCDSFWQSGNDNSQNFIGEKPQMNLGGRSIFWSGLIPTIQPWELDFFPSSVRLALASGLLVQAGEKMNESASMGATAKAIVNKLRQSPLVQDFSIQETPRALHQPYLSAEGVPKDQFFTEPTGVFNTAELLINQVGMVSEVNDGRSPGLQVLLNHFVEDVQNAPGNRFFVITRNTLNNNVRTFNAGTVVLAGGSIESPKLLRRSSSLFNSLPGAVQNLVGLGLTDHPTTNEITTFATNIGNVPIPKDSHAKIVFYSRGRREQNEIVYPFNVEMNINHEYWHLRENDPSAPGVPINVDGASRIDIKFSFGNCLDGNNQIMTPPPFGYVPEIRFRNQKWMDRLAGSRFPALAGWHKNYGEIFQVLNRVTYQILSQFQINGREARPIVENGEESWFGANGRGFGYGTVHHSAGSLRMPYKSSYNNPNFEADSVVDEDLRVVGTQNLYVCDMSVMPFSSAANPVRTLAALALRLSRHFG